MLSNNNLAGVANILPSTIKNAVGQPPLCDLERVVGRNQIVRYIEFELVKMTSLLSVGGNLNDAQVQFIATQLVEMFPNESLADLKLCFQRGCIGQYGEIYRMDGIVIRKWMEQYLDEKYQIVETELKQEKNKVDEVESTGPGYEEFKRWAATLAEKKTILPITEAEIKSEGKEKPPTKKGHFYPSTPLEEQYKKERHIAYIKEMYDARTAEKMPYWIPEEEFNLIYDQDYEDEKFK